MNAFIGFLDFDHVNMVSSSIIKSMLLLITGLRIRVSFAYSFCILTVTE